jgi:creatinine amidohydrolase/Fe(II)-dependent formamide hydrolase-like protein
MKRFALVFTMLLLLAPEIIAAQQKIPDTVFIDDLTWDEVRDLLAAGKTTAIIATAGTEQKGPHMVVGEHRFAITYASDRIARALGDALVAPVITYVPEGSWTQPSGHMAMAGTITLPEDRFQVLLEHTAKSLKAAGFRNIVLIGDSGGNQTGMSAVATKLNTEWKGTDFRAHFIGDYYTKAQADQRRYITEVLKIPASEIGSHAGIIDTAELLAISPEHIRTDKLAPASAAPGMGYSGNPMLATAEIGHALLKIKVDNALAQIKASIAAPPPQEQQP